MPHAAHGNGEHSGSKRTSLRSCCLSRRDPPLLPGARRVWVRQLRQSELKSLIEDGVVQSGFGVYMGTVELKDGSLRVLPLRKFLTELAAGHVLH